MSIKAGLPPVYDNVDVVLQRTISRLHRGQRTVGLTLRSNNHATLVETLKNLHRPVEQHHQDDPFDSMLVHA